VFPAIWTNLSNLIDQKTQESMVIHLARGNGVQHGYVGKFKKKKKTKKQLCLTCPNLDSNLLPGQKVSIPKLSPNNTSNAATVHFPLHLPRQ
jgi:hypothetical protein